MSTTIRYRLALALAIFSALFLLWAMGAVRILGVEGDPVDRLYLAVIAIALVGSALARLQAAGMARTMTVTAGAVCLVGVAALTMGKLQAAYSSVLEILGLTGMFAALFAGSGWHFRSAARPTRWVVAPGVIRCRSGDSCHERQLRRPPILQGTRPGSAPPTRSATAGGSDDPRAPA